MDLEKITKRIKVLPPFNWLRGPCIVVPYKLSYSDRDEEGLDWERYETVYFMLRKSFKGLVEKEPRAYFWKYDGRKRLIVWLPFGFFISTGFDYTDVYF
jgi:hypothetical protein